MASGAPPLSPDIDAQEVYLPQARLAVADDPDTPANQTLFSRVSDAGLRAAAAGAALNVLQEVLQNRGTSNDPGAALGPDGDPAAATQPFRNRASERPDREPCLCRAHQHAVAALWRRIAELRSPSRCRDCHRLHRRKRSRDDLLDDTDAAISRQALLQIASLPDRVDTAGARLDQTTPRWNFEIPFAVATGTAIAQFEVSRDAAGHNDRNSDAGLARTIFSRR